MNTTKLTNVIMLLTALQMGIPKFGEPADMLITAVLLTAISVLSIKKMYSSPEVSKKGVTFMWLLIGAAVLGGLNDLFTHYLDEFGVFISEGITKILRTVIGLLIVVVNVFARTFFPSEEWKDIQQKQNFYKQ